MKSYEIWYRLPAKTVPKPIWTTSRMQERIGHTSIPASRALRNLWTRRIAERKTCISLTTMLFNARNNVEPRGKVENSSSESFDLRRSILTLDACKFFSRFTHT